MLSDLELARLHIDSLFDLDADARIVHVRDPEGRPAPRFHLVRTAEGNVPLVRADVPRAVAAELLAVASDEPPFEDSPLPLHRDRYVALLERDAPLRHESAGPAYVLQEGLEAPAGTVLITRHNVALCGRHFADWFTDGSDPLCHLDARSPVGASLEDGIAVSLCMSARLPSAGIEAGLETAEPFRRRGHAVRAVAAWAAAILQQGRVPLYSTGWDNVASQAVAARLGARRYGADFSLY